MFTKLRKSLRLFYAVTSWFSLALALCGTAQAQVFTSPMLISSATGNASYPAMVVDPAGNVNVAWVDSTSGINFARMTNGATSVAGTVPGSAGATFQPQLIVDPTGTIIEIAWAAPNTASQGNFDVFVSVSTNGGQSFLPTPNQVSTTPAVLVDSPRLAFVGTGVDVVWGNSGTWISTSPDGLTFTAPIALAVAPQDSGGPRIAVDKSGNIFVAWTDRLAETQPGSTNYCTNPTGNTNQSGVVTQYNNTSGGHYYLNWTQAGTTPSASNTRDLSSTDWKNVNIDPAYPNGYFGCSYDTLQMFLDPNGNVHMLWADEAPLEDLLSSTTTKTPPAANGSPTFTFPIGPVSDEGVGASSAAVDPRSGKIYFAYSSGPKVAANTEGIYLNRSDDFGVSYAFPLSNVISAPGAISPAYPQVAVDPSGNVDVVWEQADQPITASSGNTFHLFFSQSPDNGATFPAIRPVFPVNANNGSVLCIPATPAGGTPPTTPDRTTCGTVQMGVESNANAAIAWVNNPGSAGTIDLSVANSVQQPPADFSISLNSATPTGFSGQTVTFNVGAQATGGFGGPITLGCNDFPELGSVSGGIIRRSDFVCTSSGNISGSGSATVSLAIPPGLPSGSYSFAIGGTSNGTTHRVMASFNSAGPAGSVTPSSANIAVGASSQFSVTLNPGPFTGTVNFQCVGQPAWINCAFNPPSVAASSSAAMNTTLTVTVTSAPSGSILTYPWSTRGLPIQRLGVLWSAALIALYLMTIAILWIWQRDCLTTPVVVKRSANIVLMLVLAIGLVSCSGGTTGPAASNATTNLAANTGGSSGSATTGGSGGSGGSSGGGSPAPVTASFSVQATGNTTATLGTVSITTP